MPSDRLPESAPQRIYLERDQWTDPPAPFRTGSAGWIRLDAEDQFELHSRVDLSANATHALLEHGVVDALNALGLEGQLGGGLPVLIRPALIEAARSVLYEADRNTYGATWEFVIDRSETDPPCEYRVIIDNRDYQISLTRLIDVLNHASRVGIGSWMTI